METWVVRMCLEHTPSWCAGTHSMTSHSSDIFSGLFSGIFPACHGVLKPLALHEEKNTLADKCMWLTTGSQQCCPNHFFDGDLGTRWFSVLLTEASPKRSLDCV